MISSYESMKYIPDFISRKDLESSSRDVQYIDDLSDELYDVKCFFLLGLPRFLPRPWR